MSKQANSRQAPNNNLLVREVFREGALYVFALTICGYIATYSFESGYYEALGFTSASSRMNVQPLVFLTLFVSGWLLLMVGFHKTLDIFLSKFVKIYPGNKYILAVRSHIPLAGAITLGAYLPVALIENQMYVKEYESHSDLVLALISLGIFSVSILAAYLFKKASLTNKPVTFIGVSVALLLIYIPVVSSNLGYYASLSRQQYKIAPINGSDYIFIKEEEQSLIFNKLDGEGKVTNEILYVAEKNVSMIRHHIDKGDFYQRFVKDSALDQRPSRFFFY